MTLRALAGLAGKFILVFTVLTVLWWLAAPAYNALVFPVANAVLAWDDPVVARVVVEAGQWIAFSIDGQTQNPVFEFDRFGTFFNVVLLISLLLIAPGGRWWKRVLRLGSGWLILWGIHVGFIVIQIKAQFINLGLIFATQQTAYFFNWIAVFMGTLGEQLLPLIVVAALSWPYWVRWLQTQRTDHDKKRFGPCPCGSGKKYKRCCGKSKAYHLTPSHR